MKNLQQKKHHKYNHNWNLDDVIILDYGSTTKGTFMSPDLVTNIKPRNNPLHLSTNLGTNKTTLQGDVNF